MFLVEIVFFKFLVDLLASCMNVFVCIQIHE